MSDVWRGVVVPASCRPATEDRRVAGRVSVCRHCELCDCELCPGVVLAGVIQNVTFL